jgi:hypothetical protein
MAAAMMPATVVVAAAAFDERQRPAVGAATPAPPAIHRLALTDAPSDHSHHDQYDDQHDHAAKVAR